MTSTISRKGTPSVMQMINSIPFSAASIIAALENLAGTNITEVVALVSETASFTELVTAIGSYTTVEVTGNILFEYTISISDVVNCVMMSSKGTVFDGQNKFQVFNVSNSTVEFHNITFRNGYTKVSGFCWWWWGLLFFLSRKSQCCSSLK